MILIHLLLVVKIIRGDIMTRVHIKGVDKAVRDLRGMYDGIEDALDEGCEEAAEHLRDAMTDKFGFYQDGWEQLKPDTIQKKGNNEPLVDSGDMMFSLETQTSNRTRKHTVTVFSEDEKLPYHVYGAPNANVPRRDPIRPTTEEERETCIDIIRKAVLGFIRDRS